jgi:hypothetical protein
MTRPVAKVQETTGDSWQDEPAELMERPTRELSGYASAERLPRTGPAPDGPRPLVSAVAAEVHDLVRRLHEEYGHRYGSDPGHAGGPTGTTPA